MTQRWSAQRADRPGARRARSSRGTSRSTSVVVPRATRPSCARPPSERHRRLGARRTRPRARSSGRRCRQPVLPSVGGSSGRAAAARSSTQYAVRRARACGCSPRPPRACPGPGGTARVFEMMAISRPVTDHRAAGLPYLVDLRNRPLGRIRLLGLAGSRDRGGSRRTRRVLGRRSTRRSRGSLSRRGAAGREPRREGVIDVVVSTEDLPR